MVKEVKDNDWTLVDHVQVGSSTCRHDYRAPGVPHSVLVDQSGIIRYIGHPNCIRLEDAIEKLLNGETIGPREFYQEEEKM